MKREHYSHAIADERKRKKRAEAETRTIKRAKRGDTEQIVRLDRQGHMAIKERARLMEKHKLQKQGTLP